MARKLVILSGPSGTGKSTIAKQLLKNEKFNLSFSISVCTRKKREGEIEGKDYYFLTIDKFKSKIEDNEFLEWEEVYPTCYYGTLKIEVERIKSMGKNVIFDVDINGALSIKRSYKEDAVTIFIKPPSIEALEERLQNRSTETDDNLAKRLRKANMEMAYARKFDHIVINENLENAVKEAEEIVEKFIP
ncbi:Guanylate kinase [subsurface metagenome]